MCWLVNMLKTITDLKGLEHKYNDCMSCEILNGNLNCFGGILHQTENFYVCQDFEIPINGFIIISSKKHYSTINQFSNEEKIEFIMLVDKVLKKLKKIGVAEEFILVQGERSDIHFHTSLFPRKDWMKEKFGRVIANLKQIQEYAKNNMRTAENLKQIKQTCENLKKELNKN